MSLFETVRHWVSGKSLPARRRDQVSAKTAPTDRREEVRAILLEAFYVVGVFGKFMEREADFAERMNQRRARLPFRKGTIKHAIDILQIATRHAGGRASLVEFLSPKEVQYLFSAQFQDSMVFGLSFLHEFVHPSEAPDDAEELNRVLKLVAEIDPEQWKDIRSN